MRSSRPSLLSFLFTGLLLFGCGATAAPSNPDSKPNPASAGKLVKPDADGRLTLAVSEQAEVRPGLVLTLEGVVADSRCPVDVTCVWAGEIRVAFALESPQTDAPRLEFELSSTAPLGTVRGLEFELLGALPAPRSTRTLAPADYSIALRVTTAAAGEAQ